MNFRIFSPLRIGFLSLCAALGISHRADAAVIFPESSELAHGHWVKINFTSTGLYEITYDQLRAMGFSDPSKVGIFGNGGQIQPMQFKDAAGNPEYRTTLPPVAVLHTDNKIIFFGQGPEVINQLTKNAARPAAQQFDVVSYNPYTTCGSYFLTDSRDDMLTPPKASGMVNTSKPYFTSAWFIDYHELEKTNPMNKGREYFGENLKEGPVTIPYSIPAAASGDPASILLRGAHYSYQSGSLTGTVASQDLSSDFNIALRAMANGDYYATSVIPWFSTTLPGAEGNISINYNGSADWAYLDRMIVASKSAISFAPGQSSIMVYTGEYDPATYGYVKMTGVPEDLVVWDINTPQDVTTLPRDVYSDFAYVRYLRGAKEQGMMLAFSPSATHASIDSWSEVNVPDLHKLGLDEMPDLLIITLPAFREAAERIADLHKRMEGFNTAIVYSEDVVNEFSAGVNDPMAYRALAKMLYDRDDPQNRRFRNILMLGPALRDMRGLEQVNPYGTLISNQSFLGQNVDESFTLNDWYGMMEDRTAYTPDATAPQFALVPMQIGVGNIPCLDPSDASTYVDKLEQFYADDSLAYWLSNGNYCADSSDNNEHQNVMEALYHDMDDLTGSAMTGNKLYVNLYSYKNTTNAFVRRLAEGAMHNWYLGHADPSGLSGEFWSQNDESKLSNTRLGFMTIAGCTITEYDCGVRGSGERLVFLPGKGLVGSVMTTRSGYSFSNYVVAQLFQRACLLDSPSDETKLLSQPRTVGEAYALGKTAYTNNANKLAYVLLSDPALTLPYPSADVAVTIDGDTPAGAASVYPHSEIKLDGAIRDRAGQTLEDFTGTVVAKVYDAPVTIPTVPRNGAEVKEITMDEVPVAVAAFEVTDGRFSGTLMLPSSISSRDGASARIKFSAFNPTDRRAALGIRTLEVLPYDEAHAVASDLPPTIESIYVNTPDYEEGMTVAPNFTLYADITDDHGVMVYEVGSMSALTLLVDGRKSRTDLNQYVTFADGGRTCKLAYPMSELTAGMHTLTLQASDSEGQQVSRSMTVKVGNPQLYGELITPDEPARESALFSFKATEETEDISCTIVILDHTGREILSAPMKDLSYEWNLKDAAGERVPAGIYSAVCRLSAPGMSQGATSPTRVIVF